MDFSVDIEIISDTATPAVNNLARVTEPGQLARKVRDPLLHLVQRHFESLPPNNNHWPPTGFWKSASDSTYAVDDDSGVTIITYQLGVRQRLLGGRINAGRAKNLSIPAYAESYGRVPAYFNNLVFVQFGRGQDAPKALVQISDASVARSAASQKTMAEKVMFWLKPTVLQYPNPHVLPNDDEIFSTINETLNSSAFDS